MATIQPRQLNHDHQTIVPASLPQKGRPAPGVHLVASCTLAVTFMTSSAFAGPVVHVHDEYGLLATVDVTTGSVNTIGSMGVVMTDIAFNSQGELFGISFDGLYRIDAATAEAEFVGYHGVAGGNALAFSQSDELYAAGAGTAWAYQLDVNTAAHLGCRDLEHASAGDLVFLGDWLYLSAIDGQLIKENPSAWDPMNPGHGSWPILEPVGPLGVADVFGLAAGPDGQVYGFAENEAYRINLDTGAAEFLSSFAGQGLGQVFGAAYAVPEPTLGAFASVLSLLLARRMRRTNPTA